MNESFLNDSIYLYCGDCLEVLPTLPENSIDSCVCDPPYHLISIVKRFGGKNAKPVRVDNINASNDLKAAHARAAAGFMGKQWDGGDVAFDPDTWRAVLRVLKPGAWLAAMGGTRTYHRLACAIEDAGFTVYDMIAWTYGSGFPKSHNLGDGFGTALKPALEPICLARKPLSEKTIAANVLRWGTGGLNIEGCRVGTEKIKTSINTTIQKGRFGGGVERASLPQQQTTHNGRWPANFIHDGSEEVLAAFPNSNGQQGDVRGTEPSHTGNANTVCYGEYGRMPFAKRSDKGSAARFFYHAKANKEDRVGSKHPTCKPVDLMQYLVRLVTPKGGVVLDPFAGTGTTGAAAWHERMRAVLIEREPEYCEDIRRRMELIPRCKEKVRETKETPVTRKLKFRSAVSSL